MVTRIYANCNNSNVIQEIEYINYLILKKLQRTVISFFYNVVPTNKVQALQDYYFRTLTNNRIIILPKFNKLPKTFSFNEKRLMKNLSKLFSSDEKYEKYFDTYFIEDLTLAAVDEGLGKVLNESNQQQHRIVIINTPDNERLEINKDIVYSLDSNNYKYYKSSIENPTEKILKNFLLKDLQKLQKNFKEDVDFLNFLKKLTIYYELGTTAISAKSFNI